MKDIRQYIAKATIACFPLIEGFGVKTRVLEALAMGKPSIITFHVKKSLDIHSPSNDVVIIANNARDFASKIIALIDDKQLRLKLSINARKWSEKRSWKNVTKILNETLLDLLNYDSA